jgi:integrase
MMARKRTLYHHLPPMMRARRQKSGKVYYYLDMGGRPRREQALGSDLIKALGEYSKITMGAGNVSAPQFTFLDLMQRYVAEVLPRKAPRTQRDNLKELEVLKRFFGDPPAPLAQIKPIHVRQFLDWRGAAPVRANREKALFSHMWNAARGWGMTDAPNPCSGIRGNRESGRDIYITDEVFKAIWMQADPCTQDAMDLAYLTGQRPGDLLRFQKSDLSAGHLNLRQGKTGVRLRIEVKGELAELLDRVAARPKASASTALLQNEAGVPLSAFVLDSRFEKARKKAAELANAQAAPALADAIMKAQFRDLRAKAATDQADATGIREAQKQLGHANLTMTEHYVRKRMGEKVKSTR